MFCKYCGKQIDDNLSFCPYCGKNVKAENVKNDAPTEKLGADINSVDNAQAVQENVATPSNAFEVHQTQASENVNTQDDLGVTLGVQEPPKKRRKLPIVLSIVGVCVVALAIVVALNFSYILGTAIKTFGSPGDYMRFVEAKEITNLASSVSEAYDENFLQVLDSDKSQTGKLSVKLSDSGKELISALMGSSDEVPLDWLSEVNISAFSNRDGNTQQMKLGIGLGEANIISADCIMDIKNKVMYIAIPELSETYLKVDIEDMGDFSFDDIDKTVKALPDKSELYDFIEKYGEIVIDNLDDVDLDDATLEIGDTEQDCTKLTLTVTQRQVLEICREILKEAKEDEEITKVIENLASSMNVSVDANEKIDDLIDMVEEEIDNLDGDGEELFTLVDYVNGSHEIIGRSIEFNDEEALSYGKVEDGDNVYYQLKVGDEFLVTGEAEESGDAINGEFVAEAEGKELIVVEAKDFNTDEFTGTLSIKPGESFSEATNSAIPVAISDAAIELNLLEDGIDIKLLVQGEELVSIGSSAKTEDSKSIDIPDESDVCDVTDESDLQEYLMSIDVYSIIDNLEKAGLPEELIEELQNTLLDMAMSSY